MQWLKEKIFKNIGIILILIFFMFISSIGIFYNYSLATTVGDEPVIMAATLKMLAEPSIRPDYETYYYFPVSVYLYLPVMALALLVFFFSPQISGIAALKAFGIVEFAKLLPVARFVTVLVGAATVYLIYKIVIKLFKHKPIAILAAYLLTTSLMFVQLAHFARVWIPQVFFILLAFYFIITMYQKENPRVKDYLLVALMIGLSLGTHLVGGVIYAPFLVVHYLKNKKRKFREIIFEKKLWLVNFTLLLFIPILYYLNPYGFSNYFGFASRSTQSLVTSDPGGQWSVDLAQGIFYYPLVLWEYSPVLLFLSVIGLGFSFIKKRKLFFIITSFMLMYYLVVGPLFARSFAEPRYILPLVPFMAILASYAVYRVYERIKINLRAKKILLIFFLGYFLYLPLLWDYKIIQPSTRLIAIEWIYGNIPNGSRIINYDQAAALNENKQTFIDFKKFNPYFFTRKRAFLLASEESSLPQPNYYVLYPDYYPILPPELMNRDYDYAIISWWNREGYQRQISETIIEDNVDKFKLIKSFPEGVDENYETVDIANNMRKPFYYLHRMKYTGPVIQIFQIEK